VKPCSCRPREALGYLPETVRPGFSGRFFAQGYAFMEPSRERVHSARLGGSSPDFRRTPQREKPSKLANCPSKEKMRDAPPGVHVTIRAVKCRGTAGSAGGFPMPRITHQPTGATGPPSGLVRPMPSRAVKFPVVTTSAFGFEDKRNVGGGPSQGEHLLLSGAHFFTPPKGQPHILFRRFLALKTHKTKAIGVLRMNR